MITNFTLKQKINELLKKTEEYFTYIKINEIKKEIEDLEKRTLESDFWNDNKQASKIIKEINNLKRRIEPWETFYKEIKELEELYSLCEADENNEFESEIEKNIEILERKLEKLELEELLSDENDRCNAIVNIHPGAGGTEACDWAAMLFRMYTRWAESKNFTYEILDWLDGEEAGIKNVTFLIKGEYSYGYLKNETGIHRLVRISPFDANARRHTSFAAVYVTPDIEDEIEFEINPDDLKIETFRAGGAGGQHVNKTDSAVRITHIPTGIVVQCQNERSQFKNKSTAMKILKARLYDYYKALQEKKREEESPEKKEIGWGSQIRSYIFQPYTLVKDNRTGVEIGDINSVMDGEIDVFLEAELKMLKNKKNVKK